MNFIDRAMEGLFVGSGRGSESADLPDELQSRRSNLLVRRGRREVEQGPDVPTHAPHLVSLFSEKSCFH